MRALVCILSCLSILACGASSSTSAGPSAGGTPTEGPWSAADADQMSRVFIGKCIEQAPWAEAFQQAQERKATVQVSEVENTAGEAVNPAILTHQIESALLNNGSVQVSAGGSAQKDIMNYQANVMALDETAPSVSAPTADFLVSTSFSAAATTDGGDAVTRYTANFRLLAVEGGTVACAASAEVAKITAE